MLTGRRQIHPTVDAIRWLHEIANDSITYRVVIPSLATIVEAFKAVRVHALFKRKVLFHGQLFGLKGIDWHPFVGQLSLILSTAIRF